MTEPVVTREDIPLKNGKITKKWYHCNDDSVSGSKYINVAFGILTVIITFALLIQIYYGDYQVVPHGSVASDSLECSNIGTSILKKGGNAVDAAIASAFCLSVATPHLTGLDAEGKIIIYNHKVKNPPVAIDFSHDAVASKNLPTLVMGFAFVHKHFGSLPWQELVAPSVLLARQGILISKVLVQAISISKSESLFGRLEPGQLLIQEKLSDTLEYISNISEPVLYSYLNDINQTMIMENLDAYKFGKFHLYTPQNVSIGLYLNEALKEMEQFNFTEHNSFTPEFTYHLAQILQHFYRNSKVNDMFHQGTVSNIAVIDTDENYVSLVTGMFDLFGSKEMSPLGYVEDVKTNEKICSRLPILITNGRYICGRRIVFGVNNLATALQMVTTLLINNENGTESIEAPRFLIVGNGTIGIEGSHLPSFQDEILKYLETLTTKLYLVSEPYDSSNIVEKIKDNLSSHSDSRGGGIASRF